MTKKYLQIAGRIPLTFQMFLFREVCSTCETYGNVHTFILFWCTVFKKGLGEGEDMNEYYDDTDTLAQKVKEVAQMIKEAKHVVIYTGTKTNNKSTQKSQFL